MFVTAFIRKYAESVEFIPPTCVLFLQSSVLYSFQIYTETFHSAAKHNVNKSIKV